MSSGRRSCPRRTVNLDYDTLDRLRQGHPAWRLLRSDHAALVASFLNRVFITPNQRVLAQSDLAEALEDDLYALRERLGADVFPRSALDYLNDWASPEKGWLRKFYRQDSDEPQFDLTPATEKAIAWLASLTERSFVGTESRLRTLFELLRQMNEGTETDPQVRIAELRKRRAALDTEIERAQTGDIALLDDTALKDRFQQFMQIARELLGDFREVEHNFRVLDRRVRERIALWEGSKGALLEDIMSDRDAISDSDQGRSFHAFWEFLMSRDRQEELTRLTTTRRPAPRAGNGHCVLTCSATTSPNAAISAARPVPWRCVTRTATRSSRGCFTTRATRRPSPLPRCSGSPTRKASPFACTWLPSAPFPSRASSRVSAPTSPNCASSCAARRMWCCSAASHPTERGSAAASASTTSRPWISSIRPCR